MLGDRPQLLAVAGHRARDADDLRARQPLAHLHPAQAARRAQGDAGAGRDRRARDRWRRYPAYKPTIVLQDADRRRREQRRGRSSSISRARTCGSLRGYALRLIERLQAMPQFIDVEGARQPGNPELRVAVDRQRAADLGVRVGDLASALRLMVSGEDEISSYREDGERYPVKIRVREDQRSDMRGDRRPDGAVDARRAGPRRQRRDARARRSARPSSSASTGSSRSASSPTSSPGSRSTSRSSDRRARSQTLNLPPGYRVQVQRPVEAARRDDHQHDPGARAGQHLHLHRSGAQFESFVQPLVIMTVLPLSVPFALLTLA